MSQPQQISTVSVAGGVRASGTPIKIVYMTFHLNVGGAERQLYYLTRELERPKYRVYVITLWPGDKLRPQFEAAGATVLPVHKRSTFDLSVLLKLRRVLRLLNPDIVQCQMYTANMWGRLGAALAGCRNIIVSERNSDELWKTRLHFWAERRLNRYARVYLGNSKRVCSYCEERLGLAAGTYRLMHNGVDTAEFQPRPVRSGEPAEMVIGTVANLHPRKDLGTFLQMAACIARQYPAATFRVIGSGDEKEALLRKANELGIASRVEFTGPSEDPSTCYRTFDIFVLSSLHEGFANVIIEAMASGLPVVATDVGGASEAIDEGRTGFIVAPGDWRTMAARVSNLLADPVLRSTMGRSGRERAVREFSLAAMVRRYEDLYEELLRPAGHTSRHYYSLMHTARQPH